MSPDQQGVDKRIAIVGVSDEETAHLRLLMRKAAAELSHGWRWGNESVADLLIVDPASFAGQMARTRAQAAGMRYAVFSDEAVPGGDLALRRPLKLANVVAVLNQAAAMASRPEGMAPHKQDFYLGEVGDESAVDADVLEMSAYEPTKKLTDAAPGLEELLRIDPVDVKEAARVKTALDENTMVFGSAGPTARSEVRGREAPDVFTRSAADKPQEAVLMRAGAADTSRHDLRAYLESDLLGGPARIALADAPALTLDPKNKMFHSSGRLATLEPYCKTALRSSDWQSLTTSELAELRVAEPPQSYQRLIWLFVLVQSEGKLARHLDPGGTYRLTRWIEIERDFSSYFRIASTMLQAARLHEIAATSGAAMADVFDVVNAFDAIGLIEWQPRAPRGGVPIEEPKAGLLGRLRKSLKRT
ncbi:MAG TPA: hypothetical protein VGO25_08745 [Rhodanobacteraceae bacterium]|nr:hypothetical protein [Rhodanobacteraceae bacterium]